MRSLLSRNQAAIKTYLLIAIVAVIISGCSGEQVTESGTPWPLPSPNQTERENKTTGEGPRVQYEGISFEYNPKILGKVTMEIVEEQMLENPDEKPDGVAPRHVRFQFEDGPQYWKGFLEVYPLNEFERMYAVNPDSENWMRKDIEGLKKVIIDKNFRHAGEISYLPYMDAVQSFQTNVKLSDFSKGNGIFFVTYISTEAALINNDHLRYVFEGISNDGQHYVVAEMPVSVDFLPNEPPDQFEGYKNKYYFEDYPSPDAIKPRYKKYVAGITRRLQKMRPNQFHPSLLELERIIGSLKIDHSW
jgi:hypothetical protein